MMRVLTLVLLSLTVACSSNDDKKEGQNPGPSNPAVNTTDYTECDRGTPVQDISGKWYQTSTQNGIQFLVEVEFHDNNMVTLTNTCRMNNLAAQASVHVPAEITWNSVFLYQEASDESTEYSGDNYITCRVNSPKVKFKYKLRGRCLDMQIENTSKTDTFVRSQ